MKYNTVSFNVAIKSPAEIKACFSAFFHKLYGEDEIVSKIKYILLFGNYPWTKFLQCL